MNSSNTPAQLPYLTEAQEDYLRDREESKRYCNAFKSYLPQIEKYWTDLEQPEASWDIRDLRASGKQFPYPFPVQDKNYLWTMETRYKVLDNTLLVGHQAILHLISAYSFCGAYTFAKWQDAPKCKEYLYLAAYCQEKLCHWPIDDPYQVTMNFVSTHQIDKFMMAVIADGEDGFVRQLGEMLMLPEHNVGRSSARKHADTVGKTTIYLAWGGGQKVPPGRGAAACLRGKAESPQKPEKPSPHLDLLRPRGSGGAGWGRGRAGRRPPGLCQSVAGQRQTGEGPGAPSNGPLRHLPGQAGDAAGNEGDR